MKTKTTFAWKYRRNHELPWAFECTVPKFKSEKQIDDFSDMIKRQIGDSLKHIHGYKTIAEKLVLLKGNRDEIS